MLQYLGDHVVVRTQGIRFGMTSGPRRTRRPRRVERAWLDAEIGYWWYVAEHVPVPELLKKLGISFKVKGKTIVFRLQWQKIEYRGDGTFVPTRNGMGSQMCMYEFIRGRLRNRHGMNEQQAQRWIWKHFKIHTLHRGFPIYLAYYRQSRAAERKQAQA